jgi:signal transduction histidine kinase
MKHNEHETMDCLKREVAELKHIQKVEESLERVRARTMAMKHSNELQEAAIEMFRQIEALDIQPWSCGFNIFNEKEKTIEQWVSTGDGRLVPSFESPMDEDIFTEFTAAAQRKEAFFEREMGGQELKDHYNYLTTNPTVGQIVSEMKQSGIELPGYQVFNLAFFQFGYLMFITFKRVPEFHSVFQRFAKVFAQTYTRFLDLQKAEAQAREAQIEAALERLRAQSMAMRHSNDLEKSTSILFEELGKLELSVERSGIGIFDRETRDCDLWTTTIRKNHDPALVRGITSMTRHPLLIKTFDHWLTQEPVQYVLEGEELKEYYEQIVASEFGLSQESIRESLALNREYYSFSPFMHGGLYCFSADLPSPADLEILSRFAKVFEQTYTRFLDLQKAEDQARESEIQLALERVRARTMAMQNSEELKEVVSVVYKELGNVGIDIHLALILIYDWKSKYMEWWSSGQGIDVLPEKFNIQISPEFERHPWAVRYFEAQKNEKDFEYYTLEGDIKKTADQYLFEETDLKHMPVEFKNIMRSYDSIVLAEAFMKKGVLSISILNELEPIETDLIKRFAKTIDDTFNRVEELRQAESQARESEIQLALERIRARTMAMKSSSELAEVSYLLNKQVVELGIPTRGCAFNIYDKTNSKEWFSNLEGTIPTYITPRENIFLTYYEAGQRGEKLFVKEFKGEKIKKHYQYLSTLPLSDFQGRTIENDLREIPERQIDHVAYFKYGYLLFITLAPAPDVYGIFIRLAKEFEQTYTRFLDLQKAEAQAREGQIEVAMERIRSKALAMHSSEGLKDVIIELRQQIDSLGELDLEASVIHLYPENETLFESIAAVRPPGESGEIVLANVHFPVDATDQIKHMIEMYHSDIQEYTIEFDKEMAEEWQQVMVRHAPMIAERRVGFVNNRRLSDHSEFWNFGDFSEGSLLLVTHSPASEDTKTVLRKATAVFDIAYRRFRDLQKAEAQAKRAEEDLIKIKEARKIAEDALVELKATQAQLIQSEKMASLGELTAGIAHEIQNPLNFVNNFSEVTQELTDELLEERNKEKGERDEGLETELISDIQENLKKINHHGQRASSIVKGMLEHSRTSSGQKELTDINALADEYLRLAYHGLRAKDKSFNADFKTDFDSNLPKIEVIPQDIGRVLLNLINNAFQAVKEEGERRKEQGDLAYKPQVSIQTELTTKSSLLIAISDNGPGIPSEIKDKVFQPFFTTKPTGQGTGLGLSLAYDIVKAHGGTLEVATADDGKENRTVFTLVFPSNSNA